MTSPRGSSTSNSAKMPRLTATDRGTAANWRFSNRSQRSQAAKIRALRLAEVKRRGKMRLRAASDRWLRLLRRVGLVATWFITVLEVACAGAVLLSAVLGLEWLGLKVCICKFFCNDGWREKYTYGQSGWNGE